jgi:hypothetical protein
MFGHNYYIKSKIILFFILIVKPILMIVKSHYKNSVYDNVQDFLTYKLKYELKITLSTNKCTYIK